MWDLERASFKYAGATVFLCLLVLPGLWLPWVENTPQYLNGEPYVTTPDLTGHGYGFDLADKLMLLGLIPAIVGTVAFQRWKWLRDTCVFLSGVLICWWIGDALYDYWSVNQYLIRPGIVVVLVSGFLLCILSVGAASNRLVSSVRAEQSTG